MSIPKLDFGDVVRVCAEFVNSAGAAATPSSIWLMLSTPKVADPAQYDVDTITLANSLVVSTTGFVLHDLDTLSIAPGLYSYRWVARGAVAIAETGQFIVEERMI